jgi:hypothetical protein
MATALQKVYYFSSDEREQWGEKAYHHLISQYSIANFHEQFWAHFPRK